METHSRNESSKNTPLKNMTPFCLILFLEWLVSRKQSRRKKSKIKSMKRRKPPRKFRILEKHYPLERKPGMKRRIQVSSLILSGTI
jgi:hypothetical protein